MQSVRWNFWTGEGLSSRENYFREISQVKFRRLEAVISLIASRIEGESLFAARSIGSDAFLSRFAQNETSAPDQRRPNRRSRLFARARETIFTIEELRKLESVRDEISICYVNVENRIFADPSNGFEENINSAAGG